jgi:hypothetical protein
MAQLTKKEIDVQVAALLAHGVGTLKGRCASGVAFSARRNVRVSGSRKEGYAHAGYTWDIEIEGYGKQSSLGVFDLVELVKEL